MKVITATGREIEVYRVIKGGIMDYLHIYINSLTPAEIYSIFDSNPAETSILNIVESRDGQSILHTYRGYTELYAVQKPILSCPEGTRMVWLQKPAESSDDIIYDDETKSD